MADLCHDTGLVFPPLSDDRRSGLRRAALGPRVALANPLDYHTYVWGDVPVMTATFTAMGRGDLALVIVVLDFPREDWRDPRAW